MAAVVEWAGFPRVGTVGMVVAGWQLELMSTAVMVGWVEMVGTEDQKADVAEVLEEPGPLGVVL